VAEALTFTLGQLWREMRGTRHGVLMADLCCFRRATGAFGAHALKNRVSDPHLLKNWETAAHYQLLHSVVLLATPLCKRPGLAGGLIATGTLLFSGSLYAMTLTGQRKLGMVTVRLSEVQMECFLSFCSHVTTHLCLFMMRCHTAVRFVPEQPVGGVAIVAGWLALIL
ncbi:hypothetical protein BBJ28_00025163, partial [Nothophytophthora sp. Chile5]